MSGSTFKLIDLRDHFLDNEGGSLETLDSNLRDAIAVSDRWHNHTIFLYHSAKNAITHRSYGTDTEAAAHVIQRHIRAWTDKALSLKAAPEPWMMPQTLTAFRMLRVRPPQCYVDFCQKISMQGLKRWPKGPMLEWMGAAAELALELDDDFVRQVTARLVPLAREMRGDELYDLARNMAIMDAVMDARSSKKSKYLAEAFQQIFSDTSVVREVERVKGKEEPQKITDAIYWFSRRKAGLQVALGEQDSRLQHMVADQFKAAGAKLMPRRVIRDTGHEIDLSFSFNGCNFDVEVDGPVHFIRCTDGHIITLDGNSVFQTLLMREKSPEDKIVRLPYTVFNDHVDRPSMWKGLCAEIKQAAAGAYLVDSHGHLTPKLLTKCSAYPVYANENETVSAAEAAPALACHVVR